MPKDNIKYIARFGGTPKWYIESNRTNKWYIHYIRHCGEYNNRKLIQAYDSHKSEWVITLVFTINSPPKYPKPCHNIINGMI